MNVRQSLFLGLTTLFFVGMAPVLADDVPEDMVLKALGDELRRSMKLQLEDLEKPYFIQYSVNDTLTHRMSATFGAIINSGTNRALE